MKRWLKSAAFFCLYYSGVEWLMARLIPARAVAVLLYHGVCDRAPIPKHINFHVSQNVFERQMRALKRRYRIASLADVVASLVRGERLQKSVVLTFDDGYRNNLLVVAPLLNALRLPFTVFVATACVETGRWMPLNEIYWRWSEGMLREEEMTELRRQIRERPSSDLPQILSALRDLSSKPSKSVEDSFAMLNWGEVRQMARDGVEFGSHTHSHCNMAIESDEKQIDELRVSKYLLEKNLGHQVNLFAYPYGKLSEATRRNLLQTRYTCALSSENGLVTQGADRLRLPRLGNDRTMWMFTGEILFQFAKQAARDAWSGLFGRASENVPATETEEHHG
jgi:peptidoglycan/xylan/chitin deacetylase (PgdA/CDA1 family)